MKTVPLCLLTVIAESVLKERLIQDVRDAGAKGFVDFIEGVWHFTRDGLRDFSPTSVSSPEVPQKVYSFKEEITYRYCTEALLQGKDMDLEKVRAIMGSYGDSAIVAGSEEKFRFHVHTNTPAELFHELKAVGSTIQTRWTTCAGNTRPATTADGRSPW